MALRKLDVYRIDFSKNSHYNILHSPKSGSALNSARARHSKINSKSNDKDNSIFSRLPEREDVAESLLARIECLPPLNFSSEHIIFDDVSKG
jgi:hypothetical protein